MQGPRDRRIRADPRPVRFGRRQRIDGAQTGPAAPGELL